MITHRADLMRQIDDAAERLMDAAGRLTDRDTGRRSLLPGWTRGHVLAHLADTGYAMRNLLIWARTGIEIPAYASQEARDTAIEAGAGRPVAELLTGLSESAAAFRAEASTLPEDAWQATVNVLDRPGFPAGQLLVRRLVEIELHHTDLDIGYRPADWPDAFATMDLPEPMRSQREDRRSR